jgi:HEAT repeat protein
MRCLSILCLLLLVAGCAGGLSTDDWLQQLKDSSVVKRRQAIRELGARGMEDDRIAPALAEALHDESAYVRRDAAVTLAKVGPAARRSVPALTAALKDKKRSVRKAAARSLQVIAKPQTVPPGPFPRHGT